MEHPLFKIIPINPSYIQRGLQSLMKWLNKDHKHAKEGNSTAVRDRTMQDVKHVEDDMIKTENLCNSSEFLQTVKIAEVLKKRFDKDHKYTYVGDMLLVLNSKNDVTKKETLIETVKQAIENFESSEPHIVNKCIDIHRKMLHFKKNQVILTSGYEHPGKDESCNLALATFLYVGKKEHVAEKIAAADRILSTFVKKKGNGVNCSFRLTKLWYNKSGLGKISKQYLFSTTFTHICYRIQILC